MPLYLLVSSCHWEQKVRVAILFVRTLRTGGASPSIYIQAMWVENIYSNLNLHETLEPSTWLII